MDGKVPASGRKRRRLREAGDVVDARDIEAAAALLAFLAVAFLVLPGAGRELARFLAAVLADPAAAAAGHVEAPVAGLLGRALVALAILGLAGPLGGWAAAGLPWMPARIGAGNLWSGFTVRPGRAAAGLVQALVGLGLLVVLVSRLGRPVLRAPGLRAAVGRGGIWLLAAPAAGVAVALLVAVACHLMERRRYEERIAMTPEEHRRELEEDQGSPEVRRAVDEARERILGEDSGSAAGVPRDRVGDLARPGGGEA